MESEASRPAGQSHLLLSLAAKTKARQIIGRACSSTVQYSTVLAKGNRAHRNLICLEELCLNCNLDLDLQSLHQRYAQVRLV